MKTLIKLFLVLSCFCFQTISSQNKKLDSLLNIYNMQPDSIDKVNTLDKLFLLSFKTKKPSEAKYYAEQALLISKKIKYKIGEGIALHNLGMNYNNMYVFDSARYYFKKARDLWLEIGNKEKLLSSTIGWARIEHLEGNYDKSLDMYEKVINTAKDLKKGEQLSDAKRNKATIYMDKGSYKLALKEFLEILKILDTLPFDTTVKKGDILVGIGRLEFLRTNYKAAMKPLHEGLEIFIEKNQPIWQCITHNEIGLSYFHMNDYENSLLNFNKSLEISKELERKNFEAICYANIGMVEVKRKNIDTALEYLYKSLEMSNNIASNLASTYTELGNAFVVKKDFQQAINNYSYSIEISDSIGAINELKNGYNLRAIAFEKAGEYKRSLADQKHFQILNDSIFNTAKSQQIEELRTIYETEKKEQQITTQKNEIELLNHKAQINNLQRILLGVGLILSLIIFGLGFYALRQKMTRNKLEKEKVDAELEFKKKELTTHALHLAKKNEVLESLKQRALELKSDESSKNDYQQLIRTINFDLQDDNNWENFAKYFEEVHKDFNYNVKQKFPQVTSNELRLLALLKMNLSSKEMANILNISLDGIKKARYRLRKKLNITTEESLQDQVLAL